MTFDFKTHTRNSKGKVVSENHYNMRVEDGVRTFERPQKSGLWYFENGTPTKETEIKLKENTLKAAQAQRDAEAALKEAELEEQKKAKAMTQLEAENMRLREQLEKATSAQGGGQALASSVASSKEAPKKS